MKRKTVIYSFLIVWLVLFCGESTAQHKTFEFLKSASRPSNLFNIPTASVLQSMEVGLSGGSAFGIDSGDILQKKLLIGLGGIAEVEFSKSGISNQLTGSTDHLSTTSFKVNVIPDRFRGLWFLPDVAVQLRSADWSELEGRESSLRAEYADTYVANENLIAVQGLQNRFSVLYLIVGKQWDFFGFQTGASLTDVRTKKGMRHFYNEDTKQMGYAELPELQKNILAPFCGVTIKANSSTYLMAELQPLPQFDYDFRHKRMQVKQTWLFVGGVRFFFSNWISIDTGVRYQENYDGVADAEIDVALNTILPLRNIFGKQNTPSGDVK